MQSVFERAAAAWSGAQVGCSAVQFRVYGKDAPPVATLDGSNRFVILTDAWCSSDPKVVKCYEPAALAMTTVRSQGGSGSIVESDIELNAVYYRWQLPDGRVSSARPGAEIRDLQALITHELGHVLGLTHSCAVSGEEWFDNERRPVPDCRTVPASARTAMFPLNAPDQIWQRTLGDDERRFLCAVYPRAGRHVSRLDAGVDRDAPGPAPAQSAPGQAVNSATGKGVRARKVQPQSRSSDCSFGGTPQTAPAPLVLLVLLSVARFAGRNAVPKRTGRGQGVTTHAVV